MNRIGTLGAILAFSALVSHASNRRAQAIQPPLPHCGEIYAPPFEDKSDAWPRPCLEHGQRSYVHKHQGLGFELLDSESEACFVPDAEYQLLDSLIDQVEKQVQYDPQLSDEKERLDQARLISKTISDTMAQNGFFPDFTAYIFEASVTESEQLGANSPLQFTIVVALRLRVGSAGIY